MWTASDMLLALILLVACNLLMLRCALLAHSRPAPPHPSSAGSGRSRP
jgi:hypothetical protein